MQGVIKPLFCVLEDELLSASDELLRETGQPYHVVRSHNELNVAKVASCVSMFFFAKHKLPILRFFAPQGRHVAPMGVKFGTEEGTECPLLRTKFGSLLRAKFHPIGATTRV